MSAKQVGPFTVDDAREFTLADLRKIGPWHHDGRYVFVDYDGSGKEWYETPIDARPVNVPGAYTAADRARTRRAVLKAMVTRRDNKRRRAQRALNIDARQA